MSGKKARASRKEKGPTVTTAAHLSCISCGRAFREGDRVHISIVPRPEQIADIRDIADNSAWQEVMRQGIQVATCEACYKRFLGPDVSISQSNDYLAELAARAEHMEKHR